MIAKTGSVESREKSQLREKNTHTNKISSQTKCQTTYQMSSLMISINF